MENNKINNAGQPLNSDHLSSEEIKKRIAKKKMAQKRGASVSAKKVNVIPTAPKSVVPIQTINSAPIINNEKIEEQAKQKKISRSQRKKMIQKKIREKNKLHQAHEREKSNYVKQLVKVYQGSKKRISRKRNKIRHANLKSSSISMRPLRINSIILYGMPMQRVNLANEKLEHRKNTTSFFQRQSTFGKVFIMVLVVVLFSSVATGTYLVTDNVIKENSITEENIELEEKETEGEESFSDEVPHYNFGDKGGIQRKLRLKNTAPKIGIYIAYKMDVTETFPDQPGRPDKSIDINAFPILLGDKIEGSESTSLWTVHELADGTIYYYSNKVLASKSSVSLFKAYDIKIVEGSDLTEFKLAGRTIKIIVTIQMLQEGLNNIYNSNLAVWQNAPSSWVAKMAQ